MGGRSAFSWAVYDGLFPTPMVRKAAAQFPDCDWQGWHRYDSPGERKLTGLGPVPPLCVELFAKMNELCPAHLTPPGSEILGNEMHCMPHDGFLDLHLDCDVHPKTGLRRAMNAILFIDPWRVEWGGQLELWDTSSQPIQVSITPQFNRLVIFETNDHSYHGVPRPIRAPMGVFRRSLAVYWWERGDWVNRRPRAKFVALPGEPESKEKDAWRSDRCGRR
jgi:hypothetical protein